MPSQRERMEAYARVAVGADAPPPTGALTQRAHAGLARVPRCVAPAFSAGAALRRRRRYARVAPLDARGGGRRHHAGVRAAHRLRRGALRLRRRLCRGALRHRGLPPSLAAARCSTRCASGPTSVPMRAVRATSAPRPRARAAVVGVPRGARGAAPRPRARRRPRPRPRRTLQVPTAAAHGARPRRGARRAPPPSSRSSTARSRSSASPPASTRATSSPPSTPPCAAASSSPRPLFDAARARPRLRAAVGRAATILRPERLKRRRAARVRPRRGRPGRATRLRPLALPLGADAALLFPLVALEWLLSTQVSSSYGGRRPHAWLESDRATQRS